MTLGTDSRAVSHGVTDVVQINPEAVAGRYIELEALRTEINERARDMAALTIPSVFRWEWTNENSELQTPYQAVGARAVNNLANKLLLTLFPVSSPFFKLEVAEGLVQKLQEEQSKDVKESIEARMSEMENIIQSDMEINAFRTKFFEAIRSLIITGNFLLYIPAKGEAVGYQFDMYVVRRSFSGSVLEIILKEHLSRQELPAEWREQLDRKDAEMHDETLAKDGKAQKLTVYTRIVLDDEHYVQSKYCNGCKLEGGDAKYLKDASAWLPLRWNGLSGEDYGRSYVEEYLGDLIALEGLSQAILEHSAISARTFGILNPNSNMTPKDLAEVPNGGFVTGEADDLVYPEVGKRNDMQVAQSMFEHLNDTISRAFLITQVRDSERTTAEEIRLLASELETALGGAYSQLAVSFQKPILMREIDRLKKSNQLPNISSSDFEPKVIVGLEGLGRGTDLDKLMKAAAAIAQLAPSLQNIPDIDQQKMTQFIFNAVGLDSDEILKSDETKAAEAKAAAQAQAAETSREMMGNMATQATKPLVEGAIENPEGTMNAVQGMGDMVQNMQTPPQ